MLKYAPIQLKEKRFFDIIGFDIFIKVFWIYASKLDVLEEIESHLKPLLMNYKNDLIAPIKLVFEASEETAGIIKIYDDLNQEETNSALNLSNSLSLFVLKSSYNAFEKESKESCQTKLLTTQLEDFCERVLLSQQKI